MKNREEKLREKSKKTVRGEKGVNINKWKDGWIIHGENEIMFRGRQRREEIIRELNEKIFIQMCSFFTWYIIIIVFMWVMLL